MRSPRLYLLVAVVLVGLVVGACASTSTAIVAQPEPILTTAPTPSAPPTDAPATVTPTTVTPTTSPSQPPAVPPSTTQPTIEVTATPAQPKCGPETDKYKFDIVNVAPDDPDGGLITHAGPGVGTTEVGLLAWNSGNIRYLDCAFASNGAEWWQIRVGDEPVWVNSSFLGDRRIAADSLAESPCSREQSTVFPAGIGGLDNGDVVVADIDVESSADCDRVVIEMAQGFAGFDSIVTPLSPDFGADFIGDISYADSEIQVKLTQVEPFASGVAVESWRDIATDEQNVALLMEDYQAGSTLYVGWGSGEAFLRFAQEPAPRIIIDIFQEPTPQDMLAGPIVGSAILFDPIQTELTGPGVTLPITLRGWSRGFEASSVLKLATWDQSDNSSPLNWQGELFGAEAANVFTDGVDFATPFEDFGVPYWPFTTMGYFEIVITDIEPGAYQLAIEPSSGCASLGGTGQQFRVVKDATRTPGDHPPALPFTIAERWIGDGFEKSQTVTSVLGVEVLGPVTDTAC